MPVDSVAALRGPEWSLPPLEPTDGAQGGATPGFDSALADAVGSLARTQEEAASAAQALATGQAVDSTSVVMAVERARLSMQLAAQVRNKAVEAVQDIFHTQV